MILSEITSPGDKIDIRLMHQVKIEDNGGEMAQVYKSSICDYLADNLLEVSMPTAEGRMVLFQVGAECQMVIYSKRGMYQCIAVVQKRVSSFCGDYVRTEKVSKKGIFSG